MATINMGFGITATPEHLASIEAARALDAQLYPAFAAMIAELKLPQVKQLARECRANTRGCAVRVDWVRAIEQRWRAEVWDMAGYRYGGHRPARHFFPEAA